MGKSLHEPSPSRARAQPPASKLQDISDNYISDNAFRKVHSVSSNQAPLAWPTAHMVATAPSPLGTIQLFAPRKFANAPLQTTPSFRLGSLALSSSQLRRNQAFSQVGQMLTLSLDALLTCHLR